MATGPKIDYEALHQDAMRAVVRNVLKETERSGLPGDHHFYISFSTRAPGVVLSRRLKEKYPDEMTIVLQHRFWGLAVTEDRFEVNLTFDAIPERLVVPFQAIRVFFDPSVRYGLQFEMAEIGPDPAMAEDKRVPARPLPEAADAGAGMSETGGRSAAPRKSRTARRSKPAERTGQSAKPEPVAKEQVAAGEPAPEAEKVEAAQASGGPANVVSLDAFRKK